MSNLTNMNIIDIDVDGIEKYILKRKSNNNKNNNNNNNNSNKNSNNNKNQIKIYDFFSINELNISEKIKEIPYYSTRYNIIETWDFVKITHIGDNGPEKIDISMPKERKHILLQYRSEKWTDYTTVLFSFKTPKTFLFHVLHTYSTLLSHLLELNRNHICFFDLSHKHICFRENLRPLLCDFRNSLLKNKLKEDYITTILRNIGDYSCKPLEVHVLFYLIANQENTLSYSFIENIVTFFINNIGIFHFFSEKHKETYRENCIDFLKIYINKPKSVIIKELLQFIDTWDNYSISIFYLHIIGNVMKCFSLKEDFMKHFLLLLLKNINPNPSKREKLEESKKHYEELFGQFTEWGFINKIPVSNMTKLYETM